MNLNENIIRIHEMMGIDKPEMVYDYEEGRNTVPDRLPFDVDKLVNAGAVFVTPAIDGNPESKTYMEWLDEPYSHLITLHNLTHANKNSWIHKAVTKKAPTNVWKENFGERLYDGKYNQILWSLNKLGINPEDMLVDDSPSNDDEENLNEDISRVKELMGIITEVRGGWYNYLREKLPNVPEYVLKDWIYRKVDEYKDYESLNNWIEEWIVGIDWEYEKDFPITMDIFSEKTQKELKDRINGLIRSDVENDVERHENQKELLKSRGISQEPIILFKTKDGRYDLGEGWHRTVQAFTIFPEGFIQPNVYIGLNAKWVN